MSDVVAAAQAAASALAEVAAAADALAAAEQRRAAAIRAAFELGVKRDVIAAAAGVKRDAVYKLLAKTTPDEVRTPPSPVG